MEDSKLTAEEEEQKRKINDDEMKAVLERSVMDTEELPDIPTADVVSDISSFACKLLYITLSDHQKMLQKCLFLLFKIIETPPPRDI